jgi:hypothetical protein
MYIKAYYDHEATLLSENPTFFCDAFEITREDIEILKKNKVLKLVKWDDLPDKISCQVIMQMEGNMKGLYMRFMNPMREMPAKCRDETFLNRDLLAWHQEHWWFRLEWSIPLHNKYFHIDLSMWSE